MHIPPYDKYDHHRSYGNSAGRVLFQNGFLYELSGKPIPPSQVKENPDAYSMVEHKILNAYMSIDEDRDIVPEIKMDPVTPVEILREATAKLKSGQTDTVVTRHQARGLVFQERVPIRR